MIPAKNTREYPRINTPNALREELLVELQRQDRVAMENKEVLTDFIQAIEDVIQEADPKGTEPLIDYVRKIQSESREASEKLRGVIGRADELMLEPFERELLQRWAQNPDLIEDTVRKLVPVLQGEEQQAVKSWLDEPSERERSFLLTGALVGLDVDGGLHLAVNLYRAILTGITWAKLAPALRLLQVYCGLPAFTAASRTLKKLMDARVEAGPGATPADMIAKLRAEFGFNL